MNSTLKMDETTDTQLVESCLTGDRDAFGHLVTRYQSLICSMAYSASGDLSRSEDLAQETFVNAWCKLKNLRDPEKFKSWLCGIARNLINGSVRRAKRTPTDDAISLEQLPESTCPEPTPSDRAISGEEAKLVWQSLEKVPENYREPLVLFYRENQSISRVAQTLDLSEDVVKQRLSRGRKLLNEQVTSLVESTLTQTRPSKAFTAAVLIALPAIAPQVAVAGVVAGAAKGSGAAKSAIAAGLGGAIFGPLIGILGAWIGVKAGINSSRSPRERQFMVRGAWVTMGFVMVFVSGLFATVFFARGNPTVFVTLIITLVISQCVGVFVLVQWMNKGQMRIRKEEGTYITPRAIIGNQPGELSKSSVLASFAAGIFGGTIWMWIMAYRSQDWIGLGITAGVGLIIYFVATTACLRNPKCYFKILVWLMAGIGVLTLTMMNWRWEIWFGESIKSETASLYAQLGSNGLILIIFTTILLGFTRNPEIRALAKS